MNKPLNRHTVAFLALAAAAAIAFLLGITATAQPAHASNGITTTGDVNLRSGPSTDYDILDVVPAGTSPDYLCWTTGEDVNGVNVWFKVKYSTTGWISSYWDDSTYPTNSDITNLYGIPECGTENQATPLTTGDTKPQRVGGIDVDQFCQEAYGGPDIPWWVQLGTGATEVTSTAFIDGYGPGEANRWKCRLVGLASVGDLDGYEAAMNAWESDHVGTMPNASDFKYTSGDVYEFPLDFDRACVSQYGTGAYAELGNQDDWTSWSCYVNVLDGLTNVS